MSADADVGVVLSGGGANGAYEVGVLKALLYGHSPATGYAPIDPEIYTGMSVGAYNAAIMASRPGVPATATVGELQALWLERIATPHQGRLTSQRRMSAAAGRSLQTPAGAARGPAWKAIAERRRHGFEQGLLEPAAPCPDLRAGSAAGPGRRSGLHPALQGHDRGHVEHDALHLGGGGPQPLALRRLLPRRHGRAHLERSGRPLGLRAPAGSGARELRARPRLAFHRGDYSRAIALLGDDLARRGESEEALFWLALSYMRRAEAENCLAPLRGGGGEGATAATTAMREPPMTDPPAHDPALFCSLPLRQFHPRQADSRQAMRLLERLLDRSAPATRFTSGLLDSKPAGTIAARWFAAWGDVNYDGRLDLFLTSWAFRIPFAKGLVGKPRLDSKLFINEGGGHFRDATAEYGLAGLVEDHQFIGAAFGDYDGDGWPDLFISGPIPGTSALLHNEGGRRFVKAPGLALRETGFTAAFLDVNQDGRLDVFQAGFNDARTATARTVFGAKWFTMGPSLFLLQTPQGGFEKRPDLFAGGAEAGTMGVGYGNLDNDGCFDFYLGSGDPEPWFILPHRMFHGEERDGRCTGRLEDVSMLNGFGNVQKGHAIVFFDFDNDGRQDVLSVLGGMWPADAWTSQLSVNESELHNHWIKIRLRGRRTNSFGVGATLKVTARRPDGRRIVRYRQMDNGTGFGSAPYLAHVGLMDAVAVEGVEVYWPASRCRFSYPAALDRLSVLDEADCLARRSGKP